MENVSRLVTLTSRGCPHTVSLDREQHARIKEVFLDVVEMTPEERESRLTSLSETEPSIAAEVRLLVAKHFSRTIMVSTQSASTTVIQPAALSNLTLQQVNSRFVGGLLPISFAVAATALLSFLGWWLQSEIVYRTKRMYGESLKQTATQKSEGLDLWVSSSKIRYSSWGRIKELQHCVKTLDGLVDPSAPLSNRFEVLSQADEQKKLGAILQALTYGPPSMSDLPWERDSIGVRFSIWGRSGVLVGEWSNTQGIRNVGVIPPTDRTPYIQQVEKFKTGYAFIPEPVPESVVRQVSNMAASRNPQIVVPIFDPDDSKKVIAAMVVNDNRFLVEVEAILRSGANTGSNCYLLREKGTFATDALGLKDLKDMPEFESVRVDRDLKLFESKDPGGDLTKGYKPTAPISDWSVTKPARYLAQLKEGIDVTGYRDYRGVEVVGAWRWNQSLNIGLVYEIPKTRAFETANFIQSAFRLMWGIPMAIALFLVGLSVRKFLARESMTDKVIGAYTLKERIGEGGLGVVYRAEHRILGRVAAIKLLKPSNSHQGAVKRFQREVCMAARLQHPNAVNIYDFGVSNDGLFYCVMEMVDGVNLAQFIAYDPMVPLDRCIWIVRQLASVIHEAHQLGLVHRDIKPQNIMICHHGQFTDMVKVVDFGLAKQLIENVSREVTVTRVVMGTPGFIAPERMETPWIADPRIDIFSFGVVAAYLLTNKVPILGANHQSLRNMLVHGRFAEHLDEPLFDELLQLISDCIAPDPDERPSSMETVNQRMDQIAIAYPWNEEASENWWTVNDGELREFASRSASKTDGTI